MQKQKQETAAAGVAATAGVPNLDTTNSRISSRTCKGAANHLQSCAEADRCCMFDLQVVERLPPTSS